MFTLDYTPSECVEVKTVEIIQPGVARVPTKKVHFVLKYDCAVVFPARGCRALGLDLAPALGGEVKPVHVVKTPAAAIATKKVQGVFVNYTSRTRPVPGPDAVRADNFTPTKTEMLKD